jgi:DNA-binding response OmpR family regulator
MRGSADKKILVLEDEASIARNLKEMIEDMGYGVLGPVYTLEAALGVALSSRIDAAVLDVRICGDDSLRVATTLQARRVPYLLVTAFPEASRRGYGPAPVLLKPFLQTDLEAALSALFAETELGGDGEKNWRMMPRAC